MTPTFRKLSECFPLRICTQPSATTSRQSHTQHVKPFVCSWEFPMCLRCALLRPFRCSGASGRYASSTPAQLCPAPCVCSVTLRLQTCRSDVSDVLTTDANTRSMVLRRERVGLSRRIRGLGVCERWVAHGKGQRSDPSRPPGKGSVGGMGPHVLKMGSSVFGDTVPR